MGWEHSALHTSCDYGVGGWRDGGRGDVGGVGVCVINALCVIILCICMTEVCVTCKFANVCVRCEPTISLVTAL